MRRIVRQLSAEEVHVWQQVARTVKPFEKRVPVLQAVIEGKGAAAKAKESAPPLLVPKKVKGRIPAPLIPKPAVVKVKAEPQQLHLDGSWDKRISKGTLAPDFSLDLHGSSLDQAYTRLMHGLVQAKAMGARVVLVVTGKPRPVDAADRGTARGAIRAKVADWLAASEHGTDIVAIRGAHRRHGGQGALYIVLKKRR